jgi:hypothetical protein
VRTESYQNSVAYSCAGVPENFYNDIMVYEIPDDEEDGDYEPTPEPSTIQHKGKQPERPLQTLHAQSELPERSRPARSFEAEQSPDLGSTTDFSYLGVTLAQPRRVLHSIPAVHGPSEDEAVDIREIQRRTNDLRPKRTRVDYRDKPLRDDEFIES